MFQPLLRPTPYHLLAYGALLGTQFFYPFIGGVIAFRTLPRLQFAQLQSATFPIYFGLQTLLPVALALTYPFRQSMVPSSSSSSSLFGSDYSMFTTAGLMGLLNWTVIEPWANKIMWERKEQEKRDGRKSYDPPPHSAPMKQLNRRFSTMHLGSSLANAVSIVASVIYGFRLAARMDPS